jgi:HEPN domain-containing protein
MKSRGSRGAFRGLDRKFLRAAKQRFASAKLLLEAGLPLDSAYLGGYVVECALKALILRRTSVSRREAAASEICRGAAGHDLELLKKRLKDRGVTMPIDVSRALGRVVMWSTNWRYEVGLIRYNEAEEFLKGAGEICDWVERSF